ncbi:MAG: hypothetical protein DWG76_03305 [Chloroflexi bacterium]|nr:hypothetical protein [Chloroflexota bacterium]
MPTVQITQLRAQCRNLVDSFGDADKLTRQVDKLLELYATRGKRQGKVHSTATVLKRYDVPQAVLRQLRLELLPRVQAEPKAGLALVDAFWARRTWEHRLLAIRLLGTLPEAAFFQVGKRLIGWSQENREEALLRELADAGTQTFRELDPAALLKLAGKLFKKKDMHPKATGLLALKALLESSRVANFPELLSLLTPLSKNPPKSLRPYLLEVYAALIAHSPGEALYFLQQRLAESPDEGTRWVARQSLKFFQADRRKVLQEALEG